MNEQEKEAIQQKNAELKARQADCCGTKCEVYSRVCGYLRPVQNWNKGKKEEFSLRAKFCAQCGK